MSGASIRSGIDPTPSAPSAPGSSKVEAAVNQRSFPGYLHQHQEILKGLPPKGQLKPGGGGRQTQHIASAPPPGLIQTTPGQGLTSKLTAVMGNQQLGGSGDPTGQSPLLPGGQSVALQSAQIINMTSASSVVTSTTHLAPQSMSQPIHPVSIPTPVGIHTSGGGPMVQPQMASLIRGSSPQILHTYQQAHVPRGPVQASQLSTPRAPGGLRPAQPPTAAGVTSLPVVNNTSQQVVTTPGGLALHPGALQGSGGGGGGRGGGVGSVGLSVPRPATPPVHGGGGAGAGAGARGGTAGGATIVPSSVGSVTPGHLHHHHQQQQERSAVSVVPAATSVQITIQQQQQQHGLRGGAEVRPVSTPRQPQPTAKITVCQPTISHSTVTGGKLTATANANKGAAALSLAHLKSGQATHKVMTTHAGSIAAALPKTKGTGYGNLAHTIPRQKIVVTQTPAQQPLQQQQQQQQHHAQHSTIITANTKTVNLSQQQRTQKVVIPQTMNMPGSNLSMQAQAALPKSVSGLTVATSHLSGSHHLQQQQHHPTPITTVTSTSGTIPIAKVPPQRQLPSQLHISSSSGNDGHHHPSSSSSSSSITTSAAAAAIITTAPPHPSTLFPRAVPTTAPVVVSAVSAAGDNNSISGSVTVPRTGTVYTAGGGVGGVAGGGTLQQNVLAAAAAAAATTASDTYQYPPYFLQQYQQQAAAAAAAASGNAAAAIRPSMATALAAAVSNSQTPHLAASFHAAAAAVAASHAAPAARTAAAAAATPANAATAANNSAEQLIKVHHNSSASAGGVDPASSHHPPPQPNTKASPLPSILRKRTHEGVMLVKKNLGTVFSDMAENSSVSHSVSPKGSLLDPNREVSQSSTDTASSNDSPHQNIDHRGKMEASDSMENGNGALGFSSLTNSLQATEASPRKKPRKQNFAPTTDEKDIPEDEEVTKFIQKIALRKEKEKAEQLKKEEEEEEEYIDEEGIRYTREKQRPPITMSNHYSSHWKSRINHFQKYSDVKRKEERKPTVNELANQKGIHHKTSGWQLYQFSSQFEELSKFEKETMQDLQEYHAEIPASMPRNKITLISEDDITMINELNQGNIQRCQEFITQMSDARTQLLKILNHKPRIHEIINKHHSKRPIKRKDR